MKETLATLTLAVVLSLSSFVTAQSEVHSYNRGGGNYDVGYATNTEVRLITRPTEASLSVTVNDDIVFRGDTYDAIDVEFDNTLDANNSSRANLTMRIGGDTVYSSHQNEHISWSRRRFLQRSCMLSGSTMSVGGISVWVQMEAWAGRRGDLRLGYNAERDKTGRVRIGPKHLYARSTNGVTVWATGSSYVCIESVYKILHDQAAVTWEATLDFFTHKVRPQLSCVDFQGYTGGVEIDLQPSRIYWKIEASDWFWHSEFYLAFDWNTGKGEMRVRWWKSYDTIPNTLVDSTQDWINIQNLMTYYPPGIVNYGNDTSAGDGVYHHFDS